MLLRYDHSQVRGKVDFDIRLNTAQKGFIRLDSRAAVSACSPDDAVKASAWRVTVGGKQGQRSPLRRSHGDKKAAILCASHALQPRLSCILKMQQKLYTPTPTVLFYNSPSRILNPPKIKPLRLPPISSFTPSRFLPFFPPSLLVQRCCRGHTHARSAVCLPLTLRSFAAVATREWPPSFCSLSLCVTTEKRRKNKKVRRVRMIRKDLSFLPEHGWNRRKPLMWRKGIMDPEKLFFGFR